MPHYRMIFPRDEGVAFVRSPTAEIDSGDVVYTVGNIIEHEGTRWMVTKVPTEDPAERGVSDIFVWPADPQTQAPDPA